MTDRSEIRGNSNADVRKDSFKQAFADRNVLSFVSGKRLEGITNSCEVFVQGLDKKFRSTESLAMVRQLRVK
jgi:hypothetical protein